jgi:hypothetical protein
MATIFAIDTGKNSLVLGPREALSYPFNVGNWSELRIGMLYTMVSASNFNSNYLPETVANNAITSRFFYGIKNSSNTDLPGVSGVSFIGLSNLGSAPSIACNPADISFGTFAMKMITPDLGQTNETTTLPQDNWVAVPGSTYGFWGMQYFYNSGNNIVSGRRINDVGGQSNSSLTYLRQRMSALPNPSIYVTGFFSQNGTPAGSGYSLPDAFYFRMPFYSNSFRIANLCVERYA